MSPEGQLTRGLIAALRGDISGDRRILNKCAELLHDAGERLASSTPELCAYVAVQLHAYYCAAEAIFERIAVRLDRARPTGDDSYKQLLMAMRVSRPLHRSAVIDDALAHDLAKLLTFRHFFRHSYGANLDASELVINVEVLLSVHPRLTAALDELDRFLERAHAAVGA